MDYSNSRGAIDMGLVPELLPGYKPSGQPGLHVDEMLNGNLNVLWVVGANPFKNGGKKPGFLVVQDMFLTETAREADVVLPAACAYEKNGTITNVTGEVQRLKRAINTMGAKPDLEIMGFIAPRNGRRRRSWDRGCPIPSSKRSARTSTATMCRWRLWPPAERRRPCRSTGGFPSRICRRWCIPTTTGYSRPERSGAILRFCIPWWRIERTANALTAQHRPFIVISVIKVLVVFAVLMTVLAYLQWVERKVIAHIQVRPGPYRVGPHGLLQPLADVIKLITKEDLIPPHVNKSFYLLAPFLAITMALLSISVIPFGPRLRWSGYHTYMQLTDLNIGVLFILAVSSMGVYGIALAGWSSNNKYALLGGLRSSAQMISYELPMSLAIAAPLLISNTLDLRELVDKQAGGIFHWNILHGPFPQIISFIIFIIAAFAETNRVPFDLPEAENELVAGFHTEYSSMKFASFFMAEYANMITVSCMATLLFLGGWHAPWSANYGSSFVPVLIFALAGVIALYHGAQASGKWTRSPSRHSA